MNKQEYLNALESLLGSLPPDERQDIIYDYEDHFRNELASGKTEEEIIAALGSPRRIASLYVLYTDMDKSTNTTNSETTDTLSQVQHAPIEQPISQQVEVITPPPTQVGRPNPYYQDNASETSSQTSSQNTQQMNNQGYMPPRGNSGAASVMMFLVMLFFNLVFVLGLYVGGWSIIIGFFAAAFGLIVAGIAMITASLFYVPSLLSVPQFMLDHRALLLGGSVIVLSLGALLGIGTLYMTKGYLWLTVKYIKFNRKVIRGY